MRFLAYTRIADERAGTERVVVVCELREGVSADAARSVDQQLRHRVAQEMRVAPTVRVVEKGWVIKTSSGKLARAANREKYLAG